MTPQQWLVNRYYNMILDTLASLETFVGKNPPRHYLHATAFNEYWNGSNIQYYHFAAAPYIEYGSKSEYGHVFKRRNVFNLYGGHKGYKIQLTPTDTIKNFNDSLQSQYETSFYINSLNPHNSPIIKNENVWDTLGRDDLQSPLMWQEYCLYNHYYKHQFMLYNDKPFWSNLWIQADGIRRDSIFGSNVIYITQDSPRPKTGEEIRTMTNLPLILGTKGFLYWFKSKSSNKNFANTNEMVLALQNTSDSTIQASLPEGTDLLYSNAIGGDYMDINDKNTKTYNWAPYYDRTQYNWSQMGVPVDSLYIGMRSTRIELYKLHKFIDANESQIMNLELQAWYGKGFTKLYSQDEEITNDTILKDFVKIDSIRSRKLFQPLVGGGYNNNPAYESLDSAFFDITLLKDKNRNMDTTFFIGISNRRTDPLVWRDVAEPLNVWNLDFIPTARFDELVRINNSDSTYWQEMWWKRLGAREITIPLNYTFTSEPNEATFKITELGAKDTTYMKSWWLGSKYHHTIDTAIYKNGNIVIRLLPGEAKMLKVEISRKPQPFNGDLTYSNQRKLIAYPLVDTVNSVFKYSNPKSVMKALDTVVYHLTYQRNDSIFYAQSFPMHKGFPTEHIDWRQNFHISKFLAVKNTVGLPFDNDTNGVTFIRKCKNPTIVVRKDSLETDITAQTKAYICYTCEAHFASHGYWKPVIVENIIQTASDSLINIGANVPRLLSTVLSDTNSTVTINASYNGNFYAWSDTLNGIVAAWKNPHAVRFENPALHKITIKGESASTRFRHPSLNTYSRVQLEECNSALVWQEFNNVYFPIFNTNIYYTRLQLNNSGQLYHYVTKTKCDTFPNYNFKYSADSNSLVITNNVCLDNKLPMVYRGVENNVDYFTPAYNSYDFLRSLKYDRIYWQGKNWNNIDNVIYYAGVDNFDLRNPNNRFIYDPDCMRNMSPSLLRRRFYTLKEPNIAQGELYGYYDVMGVKQYKNVNVPSGVVDKNLVLNFTEIDDNTGVSGIWHVPHGYFTLISDWSIFTNNFTGSNLPRQLHIDGGRLPHLAALPYMNDDKTMNLGRRVYNGVDGSINNIESSLEYFYKGERKEEPVKLQYFGYEDGENITLISPVMVRGVIPLMNKNSVFDFDEKTLYNRVRDTIKSDWLIINDIEDIEFVSEEINNKTMRMQIEVEGNDELFEIQISKGNTAKLNKMRIINGKNTKVRFVWTKVSNTSQYQEQIVLTDDVVGRFYKTTENQRNMVFDLGINTQKEYVSSDNLLSLFPNPVDNELFITLNLPQESSNNIGAYKYNIMNVYGQIVFASEINNRVTETVNTSNLSNGTYFINFANLDNQTELIDKSNMFIINR